MNDEMIKVIDWLNIDKLSLNLKKTHFIIFRKRRGNIHIDNDLVVDNEAIDIARYWYFYIKQKKYLNDSALLTMYYAFIYPYYT